MRGGVGAGEAARNVGPPGVSEGKDTASGQHQQEIVGSSLRPERSPGGTMRCDQQRAEPGSENSPRSASHGSAGPTRVSQSHKGQPARILSSACW